MAKSSERQISQQQQALTSIYHDLEQDIFKSMVDRLQDGLPKSSDGVLEWQLHRLSEMDALTDDTVALVAKTTGIAKTRLAKLFGEMGYEYAAGEYKRVGDATGSPIEPQGIDKLMAGYLNQTFRELDNNVNQTLITTNHGAGTAVTNAYQQIIKQTTAQVIAGGKTPQRALADTIYHWRDKGIESRMVDKGGNSWSIDAYARMVINTTTHRAFQAVRDQAADDYNIDIFVMTSHPAAREACATIQGHLVTTRSEDFDTDTGEHVYALDSWGYGEPGGTFGINCRHQKWAYVPGINTNSQTQYDPDEAKANGDIQQKQRGLERRIRGYKDQLELAQQMGDDAGVRKYQLLIRQNQAAMRRLVAEHGFLKRDYSREKSYTRSAGKVAIEWD